jgi:hypothetical protein
MYVCMYVCMYIHTYVGRVPCNSQSVTGDSRPPFDRIAAVCIHRAWHSPAPSSHYELMIIMSRATKPSFPRYRDSSEYSVAAGTYFSDRSRATYHISARFGRTPGSRACATKWNVGAGDAQGCRGLGNFMQRARGSRARLRYRVSVEPKNSISQPSDGSSVADV